MKLMFASNIHGSYYLCSKTVEAYREEKQKVDFARRYTLSRTEKRFAERLRTEKGY